MILMYTMLVLLGGAVRCSPRCVVWLLYPAATMLLCWSISNSFLYSMAILVSVTMGVLLEGLLRGWPEYNAPIPAVLGMTVPIVVFVGMFVICGQVWYYIILAALVSSILFHPTHEQYDAPFLPRFAQGCSLWLGTISSLGAV